MKRGWPTFLLFAACGGEEIGAVELGRALVADPAFSSSSFNAFACTDCHAIEENDPEIYAGHPLLGAAARPSFWGGYEGTLKDAVDSCVVFFMKGDPLDVESDNAKALFEYLLTLKDRGAQTALPFTIVRTTTLAPARGEVARGEEIHRLACQGCHGAASSGDGRILKAAPPVLPEQAVTEGMMLFPDFEISVVFTEKIRHGQFFDVGGNMPPFSLEMLSDEDLGALLAFYGI